MKLCFKPKEDIEGAVVVKKGDNYIYSVLLFLYEENIPHPDYFDSMKFLGEYKWSYRKKDEYMHVKPEFTNHIKYLKLASDESIITFVKEIYEYSEGIIKKIKNN